MKRIVFCFGLVLSVFLTSQALISWRSEPPKYSITEYISAYKTIAMTEMKRTGVPASITLAQAVLESGFGNSDLAINANNHFGIKCKPDWTGKTYSVGTLCYKKYGSVLESYQDHSNHLKTRKWYAGLFTLKITDYKGWAVGLKNAGYAEAPDYAAHLIRLIETYKFCSIDSAVIAQNPSLAK